MLVRPKKRIIAGVCEAIAGHYKLPTNLLRIVFILLSITTTLPIFIYLALWLIFPNYVNINSHARLKSTQRKGILIGGMVGAIIGSTLPFIIFDVQSIFILILIGVFIMPIGAFIGYLSGRGIIEKSI